MSNSVVFFCRLMCSCYIQQNAEHFAPFIGLFDVSPAEMKKKIKEYCVREVEPLEKEVEQLEVRDNLAKLIFFTQNCSVVP